MEKFANGLLLARPAWLEYSASYPWALAMFVGGSGLKIRPECIAAAAGKAPELPMPRRQQAA
jgi:hypothetical protein